MVSRNVRHFAIFGAALAGFLLTGASLDWPDLLDDEWRTRGQWAWYLEFGKSFLPLLVGGLAAAVVARWTRPPRRA